VNVVKIGVSDLKVRLRDELDFDFQENWSYLSTASIKLTVVAPVRARGKVTYTGRSYLVEGEVETTLQLSCDRCLADFLYPLKVDLQEGYAANTGATPEGTGAGIEPDEIRPLEGETINLKPAVAETLALALPMKSLCHEGCRGLCPRCGQNLNEGQCRCGTEIIDPRLAILGKLLPQREGEK
jgi:uncharacterized protein